MTSFSTFSRVTYQQCQGDRIATLDIFEPVLNQDIPSVFTDKVRPSIIRSVSDGVHRYLYQQVVDTLKRSIAKEDLSMEHDKYVEHCVARAQWNTVILFSKVCSSEARMVTSSILPH